MRVNFSPLNSPAKGSGIIKSFAGNYKSRYNALRQTGNRIIQVTFLEEAEHTLVITVSVRRHFQGGARRGCLEGKRVP